MCRTLHRQTLHWWDQRAFREGSVYGGLRVHVSLWHPIQTTWAEFRLLKWNKVIQWSGFYCWCPCCWSISAIDFQLIARPPDDVHLQGQAHWFMVTWSITGNGTPCKNSSAQLSPILRSNGTWRRLQLINSMNKWTEITVTAHREVRANPCAPPISLFPIGTSTLTERWQCIEAFIASHFISEKVPTHGGCLVIVSVKSLNAFFTWMADNEQHHFLWEYLCIFQPRLS